MADDRPPYKRKDETSAMNSRKTPKLSSGSGPSAGAGRSGKMSFAQRMMAKMGHVEGQGLGKQGEGIINPIEVKMRPQGAGVGAVKEKTEQYKQEQKRAAQARGEDYEDSSDEERKARRRRKEIASMATGNSKTGPPKPKTKFRTVEEVQAAAPGLDVPRAMLSSIVDATGAQTRLLTSTAGLLAPGAATAETELDKIKRRERIELEAFIDAWHGLQERKIATEEHEGHYQMQLTQQDEDIAKLETVINAVARLAVAPDNPPEAIAYCPDDWDQLTDRLQTLQVEHRHEIDSCGLSDAALAVMHEPFKHAMEDWEPLAHPYYLTNHLQRLRRILGLRSDDEVAAHRIDDPDEATYRRQKTTSPYETMMYTLWLPKIRATVTIWDVYDPQPMISLVQAWRPLLPPFILANFMDQLIVQKLLMHLQSWNPKKHRKKSHESRNRLPHIWLFPWFPLLPSHHLDPKASTGLLREVKRKFRSMLDTWDMNAGVIPGLTEWRSLLGVELDHLLVRHLLPRLATHLAANFEVDPANQDLTALEQVMAWQDCFQKPEITARLLIAEFFPKWLVVLHIWLTSAEANFEEIGQWYNWWKTQFPDAINEMVEIKVEWDKGLGLINTALDMQEQGTDLSQLEPPVIGQAEARTRQGATTSTAAASTSKPKRATADEATFKDVVEDWCAHNDLTLVPLREPHAGTGLPLFRLTASATGRGGVLVYLKGDVAWAQKRGQRDVYEPMGLEEPLLKRAEGN